MHGIRLVIFAKHQAFFAMGRIKNQVIPVVYTQHMILRLWFLLGALMVTSVGFAQREVFQACTPAVAKVVLNGSSNPAISDRMRTLFSEDQDARMKKNIDWETLNREDTARRVEVMSYLEKGQLTTGNDMYYAAFIW